MEGAELPITSAFEEQSASRYYGVIYMSKSPWELLLTL